MLSSLPDRALPTGTALLAGAALFACGGGDGAADGGPDARDRLRDSAERVEAPGDSSGAADTGADESAADRGAGHQEAAYTVREGGLLVRSDEAGERPLLALDSAAAPEGVPAVPTSWQPAPESTFGIHATSFRHAVPSPEGRWVAWEAGSTHDLVGVVPTDGGPVTVLDFYFDSSARELTWAPGGRYLAARYLPPSGLPEVRVYDVEAGTRLRAPWEEACRPRDGCRVTGAEWTGATTLAVTTADGEDSRHEADVSGLRAASSVER